MINIKDINIGNKNRKKATPTNTIIITIDKNSNYYLLK